jgi:hypothetical protein
MRARFARPLSVEFFYRDSDLAVPVGPTVTRASKASLIVLALLIGGDLLFIALHLVHLKTSLLPASRWSIAQDRGFAEVFQYIKYLAICLALGRLFVTTRLRVMLGWLVVFAFLLLDDAGRLHERFGLAFDAWTHLPGIGSLRARDIGELVFALLAGLVVLPLVVFGWLRGARPARAMSTDLALLLVALAGCGVGADLVHRMLSPSSMEMLAGLFEDGGEMFVLSFACAYISQWMTGQVRFRPARSLGLDTKLPATWF